LNLSKNPYEPGEPFKACGPKRKRKETEVTGGSMEKNGGQRAPGDWEDTLEPRGGEKSFTTMLKKEKEEKGRSGERKKSKRVKSSRPNQGSSNSARENV